MATVHQAPKALGAGFQISSRTGQVHVRSFGDMLTNAGQLAMVAAAQTYYGGLAGGTVLGPSTASAGGSADQQAALLVSPSAVDILCKPGDEATVAASVATVLGVGANTTHNVSGNKLFGTVN